MNRILVLILGIVILNGCAQSTSFVGPSYTLVKSKTVNLKDKTFVVYTDGVTEGYLKNGEELGAEGVQRIVTTLDNITPKKLVDSIANELNWGAEKLRDDITCLALDLKNTELVKPIKKKKEDTEKKA